MTQEDDWHPTPKPEGKPTDKLIPHPEQRPGFDVITEQPAESEQSKDKEAKDG